MAEADPELQRLLSKSPDAALHLPGDGHDRRLGLGMFLQIALIRFGPCPTSNAFLRRIARSAHGPFLSLCHRATSTVCAADLFMHDHSERVYTFQKGIDQN